MTEIGKLLAGLVLGGLLAAGAVQAEEGEGLEPSNARIDAVASLQNGAKLFFNYCSGCHSLQYLRYSRLAADLHLSEKEVADNLIFTGARIGDQAASHMPAEDAAKWFGKAPPDLSLEARSKGPDWIYNYLKSFYLDPSRPVGWNNKLFPNASMPNPLWELQGLQVAVYKTAEAGHDAEIERLEMKQPGRQSAEQFDQTARDITAFLQYAGEPAALKRESMGVWVLLYLAAFTFIALLLKKEYWKDVH
ncbi:MAG TPA: cytochrome c1 [Rhodanobacteraceae bacterium]|nr:cytochrome c1 [Rhodanobacteraceae bacterium]